MNGNSEKSPHLPKADDSLKMKDYSIISIMFLLIYASFSAMSLIAPFFPKEAVSRGLSETATAAIFSVFNFGMVVFSFVSGQITLKFGTRHSIILGASCCGLSLIAFGLLSFIDNGPIFGVSCGICRLTESFGAALILPATASVIENLYRSRFVVLYAGIHTSYVAAILSGPSIGTGLYALGGYLLPFLVFGGLVLVLAGAAVWIVPPLPPISKEAATGTLQALKSRGVLIGLAVGLQTGFLFTCVQAILALYLRSLGFSTEFGSLFFLITPGFFAISTVVSATAIKKGLKYSLYSTSLIGGGLSLLIIGLGSMFAPGVQSIAVLVGIGLAGQGYFESAGSQTILPTIIAEAREDRLFKDDKQASATLSGFNVCADGIGSFLGPIVTGYIAERLGFEWATTVVGIGLLILGTLLSWLMLFHLAKKKQEKRKHSKYGNDTVPLLKAVEADAKSGW